MIVIAALVVLFAAVLCARLLWSLSIHAFPLWSGGTLAWWAFHAHHGLALAALAGLGGAIAALVIVELMSRSRALPLRLAGIALFAAPAALAGYFAARGLALAMIGGGIGTQLLSLASAVLVGGAAAMRCLALRTSGPTDQAVRSSQG
tara:strand:- start:172 stop:615 length:444 start_codon:yes stop_codon:yes gene_type:complete